MVPRSFIMHSQERSTGSTLPTIVTSDDPISMKPLESQQTLFSPHELTRDVKLTRYEHRERMLQCRIERIKRHPVKEEYWKELQKREEALKVQEAFLQKQAGEENRVKGLSSKSRIRYVNRRRRLKYSNKQQPKLELTQDCGRSTGFGKAQPRDLWAGFGTKFRACTLGEAGFANDCTTLYLRPTTSTEGSGYRRDPEKCQEGAFLGHLPYLAAQPPRVRSNKAAI
jgi:hypothetical protein